MSIRIDGHLDLAHNVLGRGRDLRLPLEALRAREMRQQETALVTLPELQKAGIALVFGTIFTEPAGAKRLTKSGLTGDLGTKTYRNSEEARALGLAQLELYERWEEQGHIRIIRDCADLEAQVSGEVADQPLGLVLLMEGADPIRDPSDLAFWVARGLRLVGPAWQGTRYAGGTKAPGPLSELGRELICAMNEQGVVLDVSHLAEESFWDALVLKPRHLIASHSNARALLPTDRHLADAMITAIGEHGGVIGLVLGNAFLQRDSDQLPKEAVTLHDVGKHAEHIAGLIGWDKVAIGTDWDGGFGLEETPSEITRAADFSRLGEAVPEGARAGFLGENWLTFLRRALP